MKVLFNNHKVRQHGDTKDNTIPAEHLEIVLLDERHQHPDDEHGRDKCRYHADREDDHLGLREYQAELDQLEQARAEHDRNGEEEREFRRHRARHAEQQRADDGRAGTRRTREDRGDQLKHADHENGRIGQLVQ